ncbi:MAG TPA: BBP7 family outer membrane beta-barrel protein, partial [Pirellulaceae bacterium]|nr:BBP7 family outer membrane beta-barrel protein [Pirellulaceae bacterium]
GSSSAPSAGRSTAPAAQSPPVRNLRVVPAPGSSGAGASAGRAPATTARTYRTQDAPPPAPRSATPRERVVAPPEEILDEGVEVIGSPPIPDGYVLEIDEDPEFEGFGHHHGRRGLHCDACDDYGCPRCMLGGGLLSGWFVRAEYLNWTTSGMQLPPLVTTSVPVTGQTFPPPARQAGVLGQSGTQILYGDSDVNGDRRGGGRLVFGAVLDSAQRLTAEAEYFALDDITSSYSATSNGDPILARPFFNLMAIQPNSTATLPQQSSELVAYPGVIRGSIFVDAETSFQGAGARLRYLLCCTDNCVPSLGRMGPVQGGYRMELTGGWRYLRLDDSLTIREDLQTIPPPGRFDLRDSFMTRNEFNGAEVGMMLQSRRGRWTMDLLSRMALGMNRGTVTINGTTAIDDGTNTTTYQGGLLALNSNIGKRSQDEFAVVPELGLSLGFDVTPSWRVLVGYTFIYWSRVLRAGDQIDLMVDPNQIPPPPNAAVVNPARPAFDFSYTDFWAQGVSLGLEGKW